MEFRVAGAKFGWNEDPGSNPGKRARLFTLTFLFPHSRLPGRFFDRIRRYGRSSHIFKMFGKKIQKTSNVFDWVRTFSRFCLSATLFRVVFVCRHDCLTCLCRGSLSGRLPCPTPDFVHVTTREFPTPHVKGREFHVNSRPSRVPLFPQSHCEREEGGMK